MVGFAANRLIVRVEVKKMEAEVTAAVGKIWGYDKSEAKEFIGVLGQQYSPEELTQLMGDMASIGKKMERLYYDERLISVLRGLSYLEILEKEGIEAVKGKIVTHVRTFYVDHEQLLKEEPTNEMEESCIYALKRIERSLDTLDAKVERDVQ